jgi:ACT domain-containing protein
MKKLIIMVFSYDTMSYPAAHSYRVVTGDGAWATTAQGAHRASLLAHLTTLLGEHGVDIDTVEQADGEGCFAMILTARTREDGVNLPALRDALTTQGRALGVTVRVQREDLFLAMHRI